jgi:glycosyltransferase involved in cell wall biosynthesis
LENQSSIEPRFDNPAVSVLLPTRGRKQTLLTSLTSLIERVSDPDAMEVLLAFDEDDTGSLEYFQQNIACVLDQRGVIYTAYAFARLGYIRLNEYVNSLAKLSHGRWLMFWGDDAIMQTPLWDLEISRVPDFRVLRIPTHNQHPYAIFPIVPRAWYDQFGYISPHQLTDTWVSQVAYMLDIMQNIDITVIHDRFDITGNNNDDTYANRPMLEGNPNDPRDFNHASWRNRRLKDAKRIRDYLEQHQQDTSWFDGVLAGTQDPWARMCSAEQDPNHQVKRLH